jgi:hypothetical protein
VEREFRCLPFKLKNQHSGGSGSERAESGAFRARRYTKFKFYNTIRRRVFLHREKLVIPTKGREMITFLRRCGARYSAGVLLGIATVWRSMLRRCGAKLTTLQRSIRRRCNVSYDVEAALVMTLKQR